MFTSYSGIALCAVLESGAQVLKIEHDLILLPIKRFQKMHVSYDLFASPSKNHRGVPPVQPEIN